MVNRFLIRTLRKTSFAIILCMLAVIIGVCGRVEAVTEESGIKLEINAGYQGSIKPNEWFPARLLLTNNTGEDLKGEIVISIFGTGIRTMSDIVIPAEIPMGSAVEYTASVPGEELHKDNNKIRFYKRSDNRTRLHRCKFND